MKAHNKKKKPKHMTKSVYRCKVLDIQGRKITLPLRLIKGLSVKKYSLKGKGSKSCIWNTKNHTVIGKLADIVLVRRLEEDGGISWLDCRTLENGRDD